jgi:hypothetical protein
LTAIDAIFLNLDVYDKCSQMSQLAISAGVDRDAINDGGRTALSMLMNYGSMPRTKNHSRVESVLLKLNCTLPQVSISPFSSEVSSFYMDAIMSTPEYAEGMASQFA